MDIVVTPNAQEDLSNLPEEVVDTFLSKKQAIEKNLSIGASPDQAFNKRMSGNMHPILQMNLGRDFRAWFVEGKYINSEKVDKDIYCLKVLTKKESKKLTGSISNALAYFQSVF